MDDQKMADQATASLPAEWQLFFTGLRYNRNDDLSSLDTNERLV